MTGHAWEWTSTRYERYPYAADPRRESATATGRRVLRGGSWDEGPDRLRPGFRANDAPDQRLDSFGVRCAQSR